MATTTSDTRGDTERVWTPSQGEQKWRERWSEAAIYNVADETPERNWFSLTMYPYPSGTLHVGHWYAFVAPDIVARMKRMQGNNVLFPMGFDAFGLPAENAAIRNGVHPASWTYDNIDLMIRQFDLMGAMIDWSRKVITCDPEFYRWNQWIFLQMLERGLAYRAAGSVWWCPNDQTVLANEQVVEGNVCERCGAEVYKRDLKQWYFRITDYAQELLDELDKVDWPDPVRVMQRNWIGRSEGAHLTFRIESGDEVEVFTTRPDTVFGATFMVMAPEHPLVDAITTEEQRVAIDEYRKAVRRRSEIERQSTDESKERSGVFTGAYAINPVTDERIPIWVADYVLMGYGTGAVMAVPAHDERDFAFARSFGLPIRVVIQPGDRDMLDPATMEAAYTGPGVMVNSGQFDGTPMPDRLGDVIAWLDEQGRGAAQISWRLRDWLISRQRYWGTPIPVVYCERCGIVPVPSEQLPVLLPLDAAYTPTGQSPLVTQEDFLNTTCPTCGGAARRETDTMDTFVDSSWYWFRYTAPDFTDGPIDRERSKKWTPVNLYTGGIEHAILHLLYARFFTKVLRDLGQIDHGEPFQKLRNQGMILATEGSKMSKSRGTQVSPDELVARHGADALRLHLMFLGPWEQGGPWNDRGITGMERFIRRAFQVVSETAVNPSDHDGDEEAVEELRRLTHRTIARVSRDIESFHFNTMISALMEYTNVLMKLKETDLVSTGAWREAVTSLTLLMAPAAPYVTEEMWELLGNDFSVHQQAWPVTDESLATVTLVEIPVQVNGKVRERISIAIDASEEAVADQARAIGKIPEYLEGKSLRRTIYVPGRMINFLVD